MKKRLLVLLIAALIFILITPSDIVAETLAPEVEWQKSLGGSGNERVQSIRQTTDNGYILAGESFSNNGDVTGNHGGADYWIVKLNNIGDIEWSKTFGGSGDDYATSIQQTADGGYIVGGYSSSLDGDVTGNHGCTDYWVVKLSSNGSIEWNKCLGGNGYEYAFSIQQTNTGGYIVAGYASYNNGDVTGNHGNHDFWIVKLTNAGEIEWNKSYGGSAGDYAISIQQTSDGGYIVAGSTYSTDGDITESHGGSDYLVIKLSGSGVMEWSKSLGGSSNEYLRSVKQTSDGGYIVSGNTMSTDGDIVGHNGYIDYWVVKLNSNGWVEWNKCLGGSSSEEGHDIYQASDGGYIVTGSSSSIDGDVTGNHGRGDGWVVELDSNGEVEWNKSLGGSSFEIFNCIQQTSDKGIIVAGSSNVVNGDVTENHGGADFWVVKLRPIIRVTGIAVSPANITVEKGQTINIDSIITPAGATNKDINWTSDNEIVAIVDAVGAVTTIEAGTAIITATTVEGSYTATSTITVLTPIDMILYISNNSVNNGSLIGNGKVNDINTFINLLERSKERIETGDIKSALNALNKAYSYIDSKSKPRDLVIGKVASKISEMIYNLIQSLSFTGTMN